MIDLQGKDKVVHYPNNVPKAPLVSVCVMTYNHDKYIQQCLDGILMQKTSFQFEILLGEDDSSDHTRQICIEYAKKYPNQIRLFLHDRSNVIIIEGEATGRYNFLYNLSSAKGKYIALCEGDDFWTDPLKLQKQIDFLEENSEYSSCFHNVNVISHDNNILYEYANKVPLLMSRSSFNFRDVVNQWFMPTCSIVFKKALLPKKLPIFFFSVASGDILLASFFANKKPIHYSNEVMGSYRKHNQGISNSFIGLKMLRIQYVLLKELLNYYKNDQEKTALIKIGINSYFKKFFDSSSNAKEISIGISLMREYSRSKHLVLILFYSCFPLSVFKMINWRINA